MHKTKSHFIMQKCTCVLQDGSQR